jgi:hypothetical protein
MDMHANQPGKERNEMNARNARQMAAFMDANADDPQGAAMDLAYEARRNDGTRRCENGHELRYKHTTGAWHCVRGGLYRGNGAKVRGC